MSKAEGVRQMFDAIAPRYDLMNRVMTMGQDQRWRKFVVRTADAPGHGKVLDLACGTGDIAALWRKLHPAALVIGGDFSLQMLKEAKRRFIGKNIHWQAADGNCLPFADNTFDAVTFGYLLRNVDDSQAVLSEIRRVLKPGGRAVSLDTTPPGKSFFTPFVQGYLRFIIPLLGRCIAKDESAYAYLTGSTMGFYSAEELAHVFSLAGFGDVGYRKFMMGSIAIHWGTK